MIRRICQYSCVLGFLLIAVLDCHGDVFKSSQDAQQLKLRQHIEADPSGFYYRGGADYNIHAQPEDDPPLMAKEIDQGDINQFNFDDSLKEQLKAQIQATWLDGASFFGKLGRHLPGTPLPSLDISQSPLLLLEYSSPTMADALKYFNTMAQMKLQMRYQQLEALKQVAGGPIYATHVQSIIECVGKMPHDDIDKALGHCQNQMLPYAHLQLDGVSGKIFVLKNALNAINTPQDITDFAVLSIPETEIGSFSYQHHPAAQTISAVFQAYRKTYLMALESMLRQYLSNKTISQQEMEEVSVAGVPMTEHQLKNITLLGPEAGYLALTKTASQLAYLKTKQQYNASLKWIELTIEHPGIREVFKSILKDKVRFIQTAIRGLEDEKDDLDAYAQSMALIVDSADQKRLKLLRVMQDTDGMHNEQDADQHAFLMLP